MMHIFFWLAVGDLGVRFAGFNLECRLNRAPGFCPVASQVFVPKSSFKLQLYIGMNGRK